MSKIDRAIQGLREAEILQQQSTQTHNKYIISSNTLNQSIQALQQAKKDREDALKLAKEVYQTIQDYNMDSKKLELSKKLIIQLS